MALMFSLTIASVTMPTFLLHLLNLLWPQRNNVAYLCQHPILTAVHATVVMKVMNLVRQKNLCKRKLLPSR